MKKLLLILLAVISLFSCSKKSNNTSAPAITTNKILLNFKGKTISCIDSNQEKQPWFLSVVNSLGNNEFRTDITMIANLPPGIFGALRTNLSFEKSGQNVIGKYVIKYVKSSAPNYHTVEDYSENRVYYVQDSVSTMTVTVADSIKYEGTFDLKLIDGTNIIPATGSFIIYKK